MDELVVGTKAGDEVLDADAMAFVIFCGRCETGISVCSCPKDWLGNRAKWIAAERALELAKQQASEFAATALRDFEKFNLKIVTLQGAFLEALERWQESIEGQDKRDERRVRSDIERLKTILEASKAK
jgi:hypothetical protein